jgi:hypothetical protein
MDEQYPTSGYATPVGAFSTEQYFETQPPPSDLESRVEPAREFVERWRKVEGKKVVVVTVCKAVLVNLKYTLTLHYTNRVEEQRYLWNPIRKSHSRTACTSWLIA